jgi:signal peptidase I
MMSTTKKRRPILAFFLSLLVPGLGQLYNGQPRKAVIYFLSPLFIITAYAFTGLCHFFLGMLIYISLFLIVYLSISIDAAVNAKKLKNYVLRRFNKWYIYLVAYILLGVVALPEYFYLLRDNIIGLSPYRISSESMRSTLQVGDCLFVDVKYYGENEIDRGDVIAFLSPIDNDEVWLKRAVAFGGERVEIINDQLMINSSLVDEIWDLHFSHEFSHKSMENYGPETPPEGTVFVLGDNRHSSVDSRQFGPIDMDNIIGKATYIYLSRDWDRIGQNIN